MRRFWLRLGGLVVPLLVLSQFALPAFLEGRVEDRLTSDGGTADVSLGALPALRLLAGDGDELTVRASGLRIDIDKREKPFDDLDKFGDARIFIEDSMAGPFRIGSFFLNKTGDHRYLVVGMVRASVADLGRYAGDRLGGSFGGLLAGVTAAALGTGGGEIPVQLRATVDTSGGEPHTIDARADVAGLPAGPLTLVLVDALLAGL